MRLYDAHNHLQDDRLADVRDEAVAGLCGVVVNGTQPSDWPRVRRLAGRFERVLPSYGVHPWFVKDLPGDWRDQLLSLLEQGHCGVGEIGLDRYVEDYDLDLQTDVFQWQMDQASRRNLPVTIHCLKAWGHLEEQLRRGPRPDRGFLIHSYGGSAEMIKPLADLGAYFSISGYFAQERKRSKAVVFREVPADRLLVETDAPDMGPPEAWTDVPLTDPANGEPINHPGNLPAVYRFTAELLDCSLNELEARVEENFQRLFGTPSLEEKRTSSLSH